MPTVTLDIDNREGLVLAHADELSSISWQKKQLTIGDYIVRSDDNILAVIERKSLEDFGASIKDSRHNNKDKMIGLRAKTGCRVFYFVECGKSIPNDDTKKYANIPFGHIRSAIYHLMMRDNIMVVWTIGTLGTARELVKFVQSTERLLQKVGDSSFLQQADEETPPAPIDLAELTTRVEKADIDVVREMWAKFRGITTENADDFIAKWSVGDIVCGRIPREEIRAMRTSNRRPVSSLVFNALCSVSPGDEAKLLACVPGISAKSAGDLLRGRTLAAILQSPVEIVQCYTTGKLGTKLGESRAARVLSLFGFRAGTPGDIVSEPGHVLVGVVNVASVPGTQATTTDDDAITIRADPPVEVTAEPIDIIVDAPASSADTQNVDAPLQRQPARRKTARPVGGPAVKPKPRGPPRRKKVGDE